MMSSSWPHDGEHCLSTRLVSTVAGRHDSRARQLAPDRQRRRHSLEALDEDLSVRGLLRGELQGADATYDPVFFFAATFFFGAASS